jgi:TolB protein
MTARSRAGAALCALLTAVSGCDRTPTRPTPAANPALKAPPIPVPEPPSFALPGKVAFESDRDGDGGAIYIASENGSRITRLVSGRNPAWAPGGRQLAFTDTGGGLSVINDDGSGSRRIWGLRPAYAWGPIEWSPDGTRIVFAVAGTPDGGVFVINADGSGAVRLVSHALACGTGCIGDDIGVYAPAWSPDGRRIAFTRFAYDDYNSGIYVVSESGAGLRLLTTGGFRPAWSLDGSSLTFDYWNQIVIVDANGLSRRSFFAEGAFRPQWVANGSIMFAASTPAGLRIFMATEDGVRRQLVTEAVAPARANYSDWGAVWAR